MDLNLWLQQHCDLRGTNPTVIAGVDRETLTNWFCEWGFTEGVEVGTYFGHYAERLCARNPKLHLTCVDPWASYEGYPEHVNRQKNMDYAFNKAKEKLMNYNCSLLRKYSVDAAKLYPDNSFDFVYIDANHQLSYVIQDITLWEPKVKKGGIISGHDYLEIPSLQVVEAVNTYTRVNNVNPWYVLGRRRKMTSNPKKLEKLARSWMWVKK